MKKRLALIIAVICVMAMALCACGGGNGGGDAAKGEVISCEVFSAVCPKGWQNLPYVDIFAEEQGALEPNILEFVKGKFKNEIDTYGMANVVITCADPDARQLDLKDMYKNVEEVTFDAGGLTWQGYTGELLGFTNLYITSKTDDCTWEISATLNGGDTSFKMDDPDFISIIESLQMN
ncbi:MAG: hypothetical protein MJ092_05815 [Lachnospiraceae bacterium]|nr:hypothetical protein [Lachnospiraceae bacterium]